MKGLLGAVFQLIVWVLFYCRKLTYLMSTLLPYMMVFFGVCFFSWIMTNPCFVTCSQERSVLASYGTTWKVIPCFLLSLRMGTVTLPRTSTLLWSYITVLVVTGWSFWHCGSLKSCWYTDFLIFDTSAAVSNLTLRYFIFDDCVANCNSANTCLLGLDVFTVHMYITSKLSLYVNWDCRLFGDSLNASIVFTSSTMFTFVFCVFVRHLLVTWP